MGQCMCKETPSSPDRNEQVYQPREEDYTIAGLKNARDELFFKKKEITGSLDRTEIEIKDKIRKNQKLSARFALQKKKLFEEYLQQLDSKYLVINRMIQEVDKAMMDRELVGVIKNTNKLLKDIKNSIDLNEMENALANIQENDAKARQFNQLFHEYKIIDDDMLDQELREYEKSVFGVTASQINLKTSQRPQNILANQGITNSQRQPNMMISNQGNKNIGESSYNRKLENLL